MQAQNSVTYGTKLKTIRAFLGINQTELARQVHLSQYDVSMIESDKVLPSPQTKEAFNAVLGIRLDSPEVEAAFRVLAGISQPELPLAMEESQNDSPASQMRNKGAQGLLAA